MSRIGKLPINLPDGVTAEVKDGNVVHVKGPKGELEQKVDPEITIELKDGTLSVLRPSDEQRHKSLHGLYRSLIKNMVVGVSDGYERKFEVIGVGYKVVITGQLMEFNLGYSHPIFFQLPEEVKANVVAEKRGNPIITIECIEKQLIGQVAAKIRSFRPPEPYKGKGIKYLEEVVRRKAGKTAVTA